MTAAGAADPRWPGALRAVSLALLFHASGCSYLFMERAPDVVPTPDYPVQCTSSRLAPAVDTVYAASFAAGAAIFALMPRCSTGPDGTDSCVDSGAKTALVGTYAALAVATGVIAHRGFEAANACQRVKNLNVLCITGREDACRALNSQWTPRRTAPPGGGEWQPAGPPVDVPVPGAAGCTKDVDCKGTRVCERGVCVEPGARPGP